MLQLNRAASWATVSLLAALTVLGVFATLALALELMERGRPPRPYMAPYMAP